MTVTLLKVVANRFFLQRCITCSLLCVVSLHYGLGLFFVKCSDRSDN